MIGTTISHYRILSSLGTGGMGEVWLAEDTRLGHRVAVKFLLPHLARERQARARFLNEARAISRLRHASIVPLLECDERDGRLFIITPYCAGGSLRDVLEKQGDHQGLPIEQALRFGCAASEGLVEAHGRGILHRDIKPENLLLNDREELLIADFGLAKLADGTQITQTSTTLGTVAYMSPEQVQGSTSDARSDIWSLGVVLCEMATRRRPFDRANMQATMLAITRDEPALPSAYDPQLPAAFDWIVGKCLSKNPDQRYSTMAELAHDLRALLRQISGDKTEGGSVRARPLRQKHPVRRALLPGALAILLAALGAWFLRGPREQVATGPSALESTEWNDPPRVVIVPFENRTGRTDVENIGERTAESVAQYLETTDLVEVMPWNAGTTPEGEQVTLSEMPLGTFLQAVDADIGISGSFYVEEGMLRIETQVLDARDGKLVLAMPAIMATLDAPSEGLQEVAQRVMGGLAMRVDNPLHQPPSRFPPRFVAYQKFAQARDGFDSMDWTEAIGLLESATELDSTFWRPQVWIPLVYTVKGMWAAQDTAISRLESRRTRLDPYENGLLDVISANLDDDYAKSLNFAQGLLRDHPDDTLLLTFAFRDLLALNRPQAALEVYDDIDLTDALRRRIVGAAITRDAAQCAHALGQHDVELALHREKNQYFPFVLFFYDQLYPFAAMGEIDSLRAVLERASVMPGGRGYHDWSVWTAADVLRGHGYGDLAITFVDEYLAQRLDRKEDADSEFLANNHARLLYAAERWDEARQMFEDNIALDRVSDWQKDMSRIFLGFLAARRGDQALAQEVITNQIEPMDSEHNRAEPYLYRARFAALMGDQRRAVLFLREAGAHGASLDHSLVHDMELESLKGYAPFESLIQPKG